MKTNLKIAYINPNFSPANTDSLHQAEPTELGLASNHVKLAQTNLNLLLKELAKVGLMENDQIVARINAIKQSLYVVQDCVQEAV